MCTNKIIWIELNWILRPNHISLWYALTHGGLADTLPPVLGNHCASWFGGNILQQSQYYINIGVSLCVKSTICINLCWINIHRAPRKDISIKNQILRLQFKI